MLKKLLSSLLNAGRSDDVTYAAAAVALTRVDECRSAVSVYNTHVVSV